MSKGTDETYQEIAELVDAGIAWADETIPDWREHIDYHKFNLMYADQCFLGQYWNSVNHIAPDSAEIYDGYYNAVKAYSGVDGDDDCEPYHDIFEAWHAWAEARGFNNKAEHQIHDLNKVWLDRLAKELNVSK